jgi:single-strand DNA-binding protein
MSDLNQCNFIGRLGRDPETKYTPGGDAVTNFSIAVGEAWKKDGEKQERTEWVNVVAWRKLGEICGKYLKKGSQVCISGKMQTRTWEDKEGVKRYTTEIIAQSMQMLGSAKAGKSENAPVAEDEPTTDIYDDDDVPF